MKKITIIAAVFFAALMTTACTAPPPPSAEREFAQKELPTDGREMYEFSKKVRGDHAPSLSQIRTREEHMLESVPQNMRDDFETSLNDIKTVLMSCKANKEAIRSDNFKEFILNVLSHSPIYIMGVPENAPIIIDTFIANPDVSYADVFPSIEKYGAYLSGPDRLKFGKYFGWR